MNSPVRPRRRARIGAAVMVLLLCGLATGCAAGSETQAAALGGTTVANTDGVKVTKLTVPGWATAEQVDSATADKPNRVGSKSIPVRQYEPNGRPWAVLVWAHGGSFISGTLDDNEPDWVARQFAARGIRVYTVDYVLASDTVKAPAPGNDVTAVLGWAGKQSRLPLAVGGASAGGQLAAYAALERNGAANGRPSAASGHPGGGTAQALLLEYTSMHRVQRTDPEVAAKVEKLPDSKREGAEQVAAMYDYYLGSVSEREVAGQHLIMGELPTETLRQLPPTVVVNADVDDLRPSGEEFADQLKDAGVRVAESLQPDTTHGYLSSPESSAEAEIAASETMDTLSSGLKEMLSVP